MLEARLGETQLLKKIVDALKEIISLSTLDCSETGMQLQSMDNSHVSLVSLSLQTGCFEKYRCDRNVSLGLDLKSLSKVVKSASGDDSVTLSAADKADKLLLSFESDNKSRTADYELKLLNLDQDHLGIPDTNYACTVQMPSSEFARICRDMSMFSETVVISCTKQGIKFSANGDLGSANIKLAETSKGDITIDVEEPITQSFAGRYLNTFTRATPLSDRVKICLAPEVPLLVEYSIEDYGYIRYYLAPKVDDADA
ncbi:proliferating cell nuclear antigen [Drosophila guanche]|uniref:DNA sliding clamp PCNA n=1 Tax=Drosophila guanche TaxID=7266 RepID=A0A3B0KHP6_DROGU|nr:proliferating cell nuclear antigen [Drosophila guanche]SPP85919.1 blast:Proliferating cell nuclear antigen [Drosophila guanche]